MRFAAAILSAVFLPANAADVWVVAGPGKEAPTFYYSGQAFAEWPANYTPAVAGSLCDCQAVMHKEDGKTYCGLVNRPLVVAACEVKR
jgi:hypothetical protein